MNTERLVKIVKVLTGEVSMAGQIENLAGKLQEAINTPNENTQRQAESVLNKAFETLANAPSNMLSVGVKADLASLMVNELSVETLVGDGLAEVLRQAVEGGFTSVQSLDAIRKIATDLKALQTAVTQAHGGLIALGLPGEELAPGEAVVGMTMPRSLVQAIGELEKQIDFFGDFVSDVTEVVAGKRDQPKIYSLHSSDFGIDVKTVLEVAGAIGTVLTLINEGLAALDRFRGIKKEAEAIGMGESLLEQIMEQGKQKMEETLDEVEAEVFNHCKLDDEGRKNEMKTAIRIKLTGVAARMERGFAFEVRAEPPRDATEDDQKSVAAVKALSSLRFGPTGPPILALPEPQGDGGDTTNGPKKVKPTKAKTAH